MRILVLSDSHGAVEACRLAVEQSAPDQILHLGDCVRDAERLHALFPAIPLTGVPGNCDWADADNPERLIELGGVRILMMHGHTRGVKSSAMNACYAARECGAQILLFGHTHVPLVDAAAQPMLLNPGSIGDVRRPTYGVLEFRDGKIIPSVFKLEQTQ